MVSVDKLDYNGWFVVLFSHGILDVCVILEDAFVVVQGCHLMLHRLIGILIY